MGHYRFSVGHYITAYAIVILAVDATTISDGVVLVLDVVLRVQHALDAVQFIVGDVGILEILAAGAVGQRRVALEGAVAVGVVFVLGKAVVDVVADALDIAVVVVGVAEVLAIGAGLRGEPSRRVIEILESPAAQVFMGQQATEGVLRATAIGAIGDDYTICPNLSN